MKLNYLVDLEWQFAQDAELEESEIDKRDRAIGKSILESLEQSDRAAWEKVRSEDDPSFRKQLCCEWIDHLRSSSKATLPGQRIERGYKNGFWVVALIAAIFGAATTRITVASSPVNVSWFFVVFVVIQLVMIVFTLAFFVRSGGVPGRSKIFRALLSLPVLERLVGVENRRKLEVLESKARTHQVIYGRLERWALFELTQRLAIVFLLSALLTFLCLVSATHLTFCWYTTLEDTEALSSRVHEIVQLLAAPFSWRFPDSVPDAELIAGSLNEIKDGVRTESWWRFLAFTVMTWALMPRILLWGYGAFQKRRASRSLDFRSTVFSRLYDRLLPSVSWSSPESDLASELNRGKASSKQVVGQHPSHGSTLVISWRLDSGEHEILKSLVEQMYGSISEFESAGAASIEMDEKVIKSVVDRSPKKVCIVSEGSDSPTKDLLHFVRCLRRKIEATMPIVILLFDFDEDGTLTPCEQEDVGAWRHFIEAASDPYVRVEAYK